MNGLLKSYGPLIIPSMEEHKAGAPVQLPMLGDIPATSSTGFCQNFRRLFEAYYVTLSKRVVREHSLIQEQEKKNRDAYIKFGEIFDDRQSAFDKRTKEHKALVDTLQTMASLLNVTMPDLPEASQPQAQRSGVNLEAKSTLAEMTARLEEEFTSGKSPWADEETRNFYTDLCDLRSWVPATRLGLSKDGEAETNATPETSRDEAGQGLRTLIDQMPSLANASMVDKLAVDIAFQNRAGIRKTLAPAFLQIPKQRWDLVPFYVRLLATLHPYMPGLTDMVVEDIDKSFRRAQAVRQFDRLQRGLVCMECTDT